MLIFVMVGALAMSMNIYGTNSSMLIRETIEKTVVKKNYLVTVRAQTPVIDANYPGGNIVIQKIDGDTVFLQPDLSDIRAGEWWFYWNFRVRGAEGREMHFRFTERNPFDFCGPVVSKDKGLSWTRMGKNAVCKIEDQKAWEFTYTFPKTSDEVRFCFTIPYLQSDWDRFLVDYRGNTNLVVGELCHSRKGRSVEYIRLGKVKGEPKFRVLITARHHACESLASYEIEGIIQSILADTPEGKKWREQIEVMIVPFVDKDGVEDGEQGKMRAPHDHNRDYNEKSIYPEVIALREQVPAWLKGKPFLALDMHCPNIREENIYFVGSRDKVAWGIVTKFAQILEATQQGPVHYSIENNMPYNKGWNIEEVRAKDPGTSFIGWAETLPNQRLATTIEFPYSKLNADETPITTRQFGQGIASAILQFIKLEKSGVAGSSGK